MDSVLCVSKQQGVPCVVLRIVHLLARVFIGSDRVVPPCRAGVRKSGWHLLLLCVGSGYVHGSLFHLRCRYSLSSLSSSCPACLLLLHCVWCLRQMWLGGGSLTTAATEYRNHFCGIDKGVPDTDVSNCKVDCAQVRRSSLGWSQ